MQPLELRLQGETILLWALVACAGSVGASVVSAWFARRAASSDARKAVDELAETVERFTRIARRDQMRRVRASSPVLGAAGDEVAPPPELVQPTVRPLSKAELRAAFLAKRGGMQ